MKDSTDLRMDQSLTNNTSIVTMISCKNFLYKTTLEKQHFPDSKCLLKADLNADSIDTKTFSVG